MSVQPIPYNGPVPVDSYGVLNSVVQQPCSTSPECDGDSARLQLTFKTDYKSAKDFMSKPVHGLSLVFGMELPGTWPVGWVMRYDIPSPTAGKKWILTDVSVEELEAE